MSKRSESANKQKPLFAVVINGRRKETIAVTEVWAETKIEGDDVRWGGERSIYRGLPDGFIRHGWQTTIEMTAVIDATKHLAPDGTYLLPCWGGFTLSFQRKRYVIVETADTTGLIYGNCAKIRLKAQRYKRDIHYTNFNK